MDTSRSTLDTSTLTAEQRDGFSCILCGDDAAVMVPVGILDHVQLFRCSTHQDTAAE